MDTTYSEKYRKLGQNIAYYRKDRGYTQMQLAELLDIDRSHMSAIEIANRGVSLDLIFKICDILNLSEKNCSISDKIRTAVHDAAVFYSIRRFIYARRCDIIRYIPSRKSIAGTNIRQKCSGSIGDAQRIKRVIILDKAKKKK